MSLLVHSVQKPELPPLPMPDRFRHDINYFMTPGGEAGVPPLAAGEFWIRAADAKTILDECVVRIVSPLDSSCQAEIEITDDQERWLEWLVNNEIEHLRLIATN